MTRKREREREGNGRGGGIVKVRERGRERREDKIRKREKEGERGRQLARFFCDMLSQCRIKLRCQCVHLNQEKEMKLPKRKISLNS